MKNDSSFALTVSGPGLSLDRAIPQELANHIINLVLSDGTSVAPTGLRPRAAASAKASEPRAHHGQGPDPKAFFNEKRPKTDAERVACLAYFLSTYRGMKLFKTSALAELNAEAGQPRFSNIAATAQNAVKKGYLGRAGGGKKTVTPVGIQAVEALPDRSEVRALTRSPRRAVRRGRPPKTAK